MLIFNFCYSLIIIIIIAIIIIIIIFLIFYFILFYFIFAVALRPNAGHGLLILEVF